MKCRKVRPRLLRVPQAVSYLDNVVTIGTFRNWICAGRIPVVRLGRAVCVRTDVLDDLAAGRASTAKSAAVSRG
jgi:hypothetical protein